MTAKITHLSDELISQIAAGEVIERPASVVKELVDNSLDAGATQIAIEIEEGGMKSIRVLDNGEGIAAPEARLAFERHATSKIESLDDLFKIRSLGFRGEALASIAGIARVVLKTRKADVSVGVRLELSGGKEISFEEWAGPEGTEIQVLGLFHHTPARKKYMKSEKTEYARSFDWICQIALAHPEVGFRLKRDGNEVLNLPAKQDLKERVRGLFGREAAEALLPVHYEQSNLKLSGYVGKPEMARSSKRYQFLFVNGRAIEARAVSHAVKEAFHSLLMHEKYPWFLLNLHIDPAFVDVNVHPRKLEVRFLNPQEVFQTVLRSVHRGLENSTAQVMGKTYTEEKAAFSFPDSTPAAFSFPRVTQESRDFAPSAKLFEIQGQAMRPVAQIGNSYIVAESEEGLVLIDQHAAHERVRYTRFMEAQKEGKPLIQPLLTPLELELGADLSQLVTQHINDLQDLGFELETFGPATFLLRAVPAGLEKKNPSQVVQEILTELAGELKSRTLKDFKEALLTMTACRGAIKFGDPLTLPEMQALLNDMESTKHATHCPHGRPALVTLTFDGLETLFKRKNF